MRREFHCAKPFFDVAVGQKVEMNPSDMLLYHLPSHVLGDIWVGVSDRSFLFTGDDTAVGVSNLMHSFLQQHDNCLMRISCQTGMVV